MFKRILPFLMIAAAFLTASAPAQTASLQVNNMEIDIWPEYDQPQALVIYRISFASLTSFPAQVSFKIPASAGDPYSVAMKDLDGLLYDLEYTVIPDGSWNQINFITSTPDIQLEYYDPIQQDSSGNRDYSFRWISDYPINSLKIVVQQPKFATSMTILPNFGEGVVDPDDGLTYYTSYIGSVNLGQSINVTVHYQKTNNQLSASTLPVRAVTALPQKAGIWLTLREIFEPVWENRSLLIAGIFLLAGILFMMAVILLTSYRKRRRLYGMENPQKGTQKKPQRAISESVEIFCHVCGKRAHPGDLYCRACGSKLIYR